MSCASRSPVVVIGANARVASLAVAIGVQLLGCNSDPRCPVPPVGALVTDVVPAGFPAGTPATRAPADNALTEVRAELGRRLFFDKQLSRTREIACGSCHFIEHAFSDPNAVSSGVEQRVGTRNAPSLANLAWGASFFWDGRARTLEDQAGQPIENPLEMDLPLDEAAARIAADASYTPAFDEAYAQGVDPGSLRKAIASFVRVLVSAASPYDRHVRGDDSQFGDAERRGEEIFVSEKGGCFHCHPAGPLTNEGFFNNGSYKEGGDPGRQALTHRTGDLGKFKVPGLRNVAVTAPYMHDGSLATLEDVVDQYIRGGNGNPATDPAIAPLTLSNDERADLLAFLRALTDPTFISDPRFLATARPEACGAR